MPAEEMEAVPFDRAGAVVAVLAAGFAAAAFKASRVVLSPVMTAPSRAPALAITSTLFAVLTKPSATLVMSTLAKCSYHFSFVAASALAGGSVGFAVAAAAAGLGAAGFAAVVGAAVACLDPAGLPGAEAVVAEAGLEGFAGVVEIALVAAIGFAGTAAGLAVPAAGFTGTAVDVAVVEGAAVWTAGLDAVAVAGFAGVAVPGVVAFTGAGV